MAETRQVVVALLRARITAFVGEAPFNQAVDNENEIPGSKFTIGENRTFVNEARKYNFLAGTPPPPYPLLRRANRCMHPADLFFFYSKAVPIHIRAERESWTGIPKTVTGMGNYTSINGDGNNAVVIGNNNNLIIRGLGNVARQLGMINRGGVSGNQNELNEAGERLGGTITASDAAMDISGTSIEAATAEPGAQISRSNSSYWQSLLERLKGAAS